MKHVKLFEEYKYFKVRGGGNNVKDVNEPFFNAEKTKYRELSSILDQFNLTSKEWIDFNKTLRIKPEKQINVFGEKEKIDNYYPIQVVPNSNSKIYKIDIDAKAFLEDCFSFDEYELFFLINVDFNVLKTPKKFKIKFPYVNEKPDLKGISEYLLNIRKKEVKKLYDENDKEYRDLINFPEEKSQLEEPFEDDYSMDTSTFDSYKYKRRKR